jgi:hypothetical protein
MPLFRLPRIAGLQSFLRHLGCIETEQSWTMQDSRGRGKLAIQPGTGRKDANCALFAVLWED